MQHENADMCTSVMEYVSMVKELKDIGDEYRKAHSFASVVRSVGEIQRGFQGIASEMTEQSKRSVGQTLELQTRIAKKAYDTYVSEVMKLGQQRTAAHRVSSSRKTGAARRQSSSKKSRTGRKK